MLSPEETARYRRQIDLPEIGPEGQERLRQSRVLVVGVGGLGSPVALYLAAAGVGTLGLADPDRVDTGNLQRQVIHTTRNRGKDKIDSAAEALSALNPTVTVRRHPVFLTAENAGALVAQYDIAVGCLDNFPARYVLNRACFESGKANVFGSVARFEGQASVFAPPGPCYQCFFRQPPPEDYTPTPAENGIIGPAAGIIGCIQAMETIKTLLGIGRTLSGRLLLMDALAMTFRELAIKPDPDCPVCGRK